MLAFEHHDGEFIEVPESLKKKLEAINDEEALQKVKKLLYASSFNYSVHLQDEEADDFVLRMQNSALDPEKEEILRKSKEYTGKHPIIKPE